MIWDKCCLDINIWNQVWKKAWQRSYPYHKRELVKNNKILTTQKTLRMFLNREIAIWVHEKHTSMIIHQWDKLVLQRKVNRSLPLNHRNKQLVINTSNTKEKRAKQTWNLFYLKLYYHHINKVFKVKINQTMITLLLRSMFRAREKTTEHI